MLHEPPPSAGEEPGHKRWPIRPFQSKDEVAVRRLFSQVYGRSVSSEHWNWKIRRPAEIALFNGANSWLVGPEKELVFHMAGIPVRFQTPAGLQTVMVAVDAMTSPAFRRQGVLTAACQAIFERWRAAGAPFVLGLPNEQWGSRTAALNWETLFPLCYLTLPLAPERLLARRLKLGFLARFTFLGRSWRWWWRKRQARRDQLTIKSLDHAGAEIDALWERCVGDVPLAAVRDHNWVNWRYLEVPNHAYQVVTAEREGVTVGYCAFRLVIEGGRRVGFVAELQSPIDDEPARLALARAAVNHLAAVEAETVVTLAIPDTLVYNTWRAIGLVPRPHRFTVHLARLDETPPLEWLRNPRHWNLAGGDFDVI
jgi:hypothetical protein